MNPPLPPVQLSAEPAATGADPPKPAPASNAAARARLQAPTLSGSLLSGLKLLALLRPEPVLRLRPAAHFWLIALLSIIAALCWQWLETESPRVFNPDALRSDALVYMLMLGLAHGLCALCALQLRSWTLAINLAAAYFWLGVFAPLIQLWTPAAIEAQLWVFYGLLGWWLLIVLRTCAHVLAQWHWSYRSGAALLLGGLMCANWLLLRPEPYLYSASSLYAESDPAFAELVEESEPPSIQGSAERVMYAQPQLLDDALARIRPGVPGTPELFVLAFGGDGNENVFRNEVEYAEQLFSARFGASQRVLKLINSPDTVEQQPLATLSNLRLALRGLHERMDVEDLLFVFLTSHGSEDHEFFVNLQPLPLDQIAPGDLAQALREAEIGTRIVMVSACYSGGFLQALEDPRAMVITAARADRPSFGCGAESDITYFGRAFLVEALNQTQDFSEAFKLARKAVTRREKSEEFQPSYPQISVGASAAQALQQWQATLPVGVPTVAFAADRKRG